MDTVRMTISTRIQPISPLTCHSTIKIQPFTKPSWTHTIGKGSQQLICIKTAKRSHVLNLLKSPNIFQNIPPSMQPPPPTTAPTSSTSVDNNEVIFYDSSVMHDFKIFIVVQRSTLRLSIKKTRNHGSDLLVVEVFCQISEDKLARLCQKSPNTMWAS